MLKLLLVLVVGYLLGNFSTGVVLSRCAKGMDIRDYGSKSAGSTNMLRVLGRSSAALTLIGDMLKGIIAALIGGWLLGGKFGALLGGIAAIVGHDFPALLHFKGGKGIATSFGLLLYLYPIQSLIVLAFFILIVALTHYVSVGSIASACLYPFIITATTPFDLRVTLCLVVICVLAVFCHRANIQRLLAGKENKLDFSTLKGKKQK
ncbi:glycerol-3-phosphate 1-O-acyltransferase PlsY [Beduinella massiliensis]|uniref:glycerol-3-phosphate 1-O-acyltransferase PlsY n=1 Tax=Beduinella massiliensis TaxID=1852363 RepID=UPI0031F9DBD1